MPSLLLTLVAALYLLVGIVVAGRRKGGYSHLRHTISELGEVGAPDQRGVAWGLFGPVGVALFVVAYGLRPLEQPTAMLAFSIAVGYVVAAAFPCDPGSPFAGSTRQAVHNLGGAVEYIGGGIALVRLGERLGAPFRVAGFLVWGAAIVLSVPGVAAGRGLIQRVAEVALFGGLIVALWMSF